jgi:hypothetical protein
VVLQPASTFWVVHGGAAGPGSGEVPPVAPVAPAEVAPVGAGVGPAAGPPHPSSAQVTSATAPSAVTARGRGVTGIG